MRARLQALVEWGKRTRIYRTVDRFNDIGGSIISAGMAYQALFATFAALWLGFGIFGIVLRQRPLWREAVIDNLNTLVPGLIAHGGESGAVSLSLLLSSRSLDWSSAFAALALLWVAVAWFSGTRRAIRLMFRLPRAYSSALRMKVRDALLAIAFGLAIVLSAALSVVGTQFLHGMFVRFGISEPAWLLGGVTNTIALITMVLFDFLVLIAIVTVLAGVQLPRPTLMLGALVGALALAVLKVLGSALLGGASSNPLLASFAVLIGLLIWFNLINRMVLLSAALMATGTSTADTAAVAPA